MSVKRSRSIIILQSTPPLHASHTTPPAILIDLLVLGWCRGNGLAISLLIDAIQEQSCEDASNNNNVAYGHGFSTKIIKSEMELTQEELHQTLKCMRQARCHGTNGGEEGLNDAEDGVDEGLEDGHDRAHNCRDSTEDRRDEVADGVNEGRHDCGGVVCLTESEQWSIPGEGE